MARRLHAAVIAEYGEEVGTILGRRYVESFPEAYKEDFTARTAAVDLGRLESIQGRRGGLGPLALRAPRRRPRRGAAQGLPDRLAALAVRAAADAVLDGRRGRRRAALRARGAGAARRSSTSSGCATATACPAGSRELFQDALRAIWDGDNEIDGFNGLVLGAGLTWRQATVLRAYAKYMRQGNSPFAQDYIEDALRSNVDITRLLVAAVRGPLRPATSVDDRPRRSGSRRAIVAVARRRGQPRPRPDPAVLPHPHQGDPAHQLLPDRRRRPDRPARLPVAQARAVGDPGPAACRGRSSRSSSTHRGSRARTCGSARSPAAACAGPTAATTSAPRCSAWSRRRW